MHFSHVTRETLLIACSSLIAAIIAAPAAAADAKAAQTQSCILMSAVDHTRVIDGRTILVVMKGKGGFQRINLVSRCMGLATEEAFVFNMQTYELCKSTPLRVLNGGTCIIDEIVSITAEEAKALRAKK